MCYLWLRAMCVVRHKQRHVIRNWDSLGHPRMCVTRSDFTQRDLVVALCSRDVCAASFNCVIYHCVIMFVGLRLL